MSINTIQRAEGTARTFLVQALKIAQGNNIEDTENEPVSGAVPDAALLAFVPPDILAASLEDRPEQQERILQAVLYKSTMTFKSGTLMTLPPEPFAITINALLESRVTTPHKIRSALTFEEWTDTVSKERLCEVVVHDAWWLKEENAAALVAILNLFDTFVDAKRKLRSLGIDRLLKDLPGNLVRGIARIAMQFGLNDGSPLDPEHVFQTATNEDLVKHMDPSYLWDRLVFPLLHKLELFREPVPDTDALDHAAEQVASGSAMAAEPPAEASDDDAASTDAADPDVSVSEAPPDDASPEVPQPKPDASAIAEAARGGTMVPGVNVPEPASSDVEAKPSLGEIPDPFPKA